MFENIKCYVNLRKVDKYIKGLKTLGEITNDEKIIQEANNVLYLHAIIRKQIWHNRKMAEEYNLELIRHGYV